MWTRERLQEGEFLLKAVPTDDNMAGLMTKHLAAARVETQSATVCEGACGRILDYESRSEPLRRVHRPHGDGEPCIRGHVAGRGVRRSLLAFVMLAAAGARCC